MGREGTIVTTSISGNVSSGKAGCAATFPPGSGKLPARRRAAIAATGSHLGLKHSLLREERPLRLQDARSHPEPGLREPTALRRAESFRIVQIQLTSSAKDAPRPERLLPEGRQLPPPEPSLVWHHVYPEEARPSYGSENLKVGPRKLATVEELSGMLEIPRMESSPRVAIHASQKRTVDDVELPSRSSAFVATEGDKAARK